MEVNLLASISASQHFSWSAFCCSVLTLFRKDDASYGQEDAPAEMRERPPDQLKC
jgi:hypothetical protein